MLSTVTSTFASATTSSSSSRSSSASTPPSTSSSLSSASSSSTSPAELGSPSPEDEPTRASSFFQRLQARGSHSSSRIQQIRKAALRDLPPTEPPQYACCGSSCGIDCVVTIWWEEEKTWRDCHEDWKEIKERLAAEEEAKRRLEEEEEALGGPALSVSIEEGEEKSAEHQKGVVEAQDLAKALASVKI